MPERPQAAPCDTGVGFIPAAAMIGPLLEEGYIKIDIEQGEAERIQKQILVKAGKTRPRWAVNL